MLSAVLNSEKATEISIMIMRAFVRLRALINRNDSLRFAIEGLEHPTGNLNKAVKRNLERFPNDFMLQLSKKEAIFLSFQIGSLKRGRHFKYMPYAFTEQRVSMLSTVPGHGGRRYLPFIFTKQGVAMLLGTTGRRSQF